jgi:Putative MetA-pathway of phenol degradation
VTTRTGFLGDSITSVGDLYPQAALKWNAGVHNFMTYVTGDIPVGAYDTSRLANLGIGHAAVDGGGGYTYFNPATGTEWNENVFPESRARFGRLHREGNDGSSNRASRKRCTGLAHWWSNLEPGATT